MRPKKVGEGREKLKIEIIVPFRSCPALNRKFKENSKKIQKIKKYIRDSFHAKIGWKMKRWRENKNYCSVPFLPDAK